MQRRHFLALTGASAVMPAIPALALTEAGAGNLVDALVGEINRVIASGKGEAAMIRDFEAIFARYSDTSYVSAYAMGVDGRRATAAQKRAFSTAFQGYIARKYGKRFREFIGGRLEVKGAKIVKNWIEVETTAFLRGEAPFTVTFHVSDRSGKELFFNMFIEGVNLLLTERTEVGALIDRNGGDIDAMIADLRKLG
ncbi:phospholipid-binding protein MlaC [uncultured Tateyamaria sp.]|uniref:MlaC/ttg2D family ABC transporter substrate-binding protein n=1 Tax=uncultured Tateyamaria sp. TaxID=455651 RepID=UPI002634FC65|nr:ABC transporter substrate-binding protein [uncultured Tateyamaria sp.]